MDSFARKLRSRAGGGGGGGGEEAEQANGRNGLHLQNEEDLTPLPSLNNNKVYEKHFVRDKNPEFRSSVERHHPSEAVFGETATSSAVAAAAAAITAAATTTAA